MILIQTLREGYGVDQVHSTLTVGELMRLLSDYSEDMPIYLSFDNGYTYGGITAERLERMKTLAS